MEGLIVGQSYGDDVEELDLGELGRRLGKTQQKIERLEYERSVLISESIDRLEAEGEIEAADALRQVDPADLTDGTAAIQLLGAALRGDE